MLSKSFIAPIFLLALTSSVNAHALIAPALGVKGNGARSDVQRPSPAKPCSNVDILQNLDTSTPVQAAADGTFSPSITDFNPGADGSRSIKTVQVDATGIGKNFVDAKMVVNGDPNPATVDTQQLTVQLPAGTECTGGAGKNRCLASFTTTAGFGNCIVVSQGAGGAKAVSSPSTTSQVTPAVSGAAKGKNLGAGKSGDNSSKDKKKGKQADKTAESSAVPSTTSQATSTPTGVANLRAEIRAAGDDDQANLAQGGSAFARGNTQKRVWSSRELV